MHPRFSAARTAVALAFGAACVAPIAALSAQAIAIPHSPNHTYVPTITVPQGGGGVGAQRYSTPFGTANNGVYDFGTQGMQNFDGVVQLAITRPEGVAGCTGAVLQGGFHVLLAAHCVTNTSGQLVTTSIDIRGIGPTNTLASFAVEAGSAISVRDGYTGNVVDERDLAIVTLSEAAPEWATRYSIYNGSAADVLGKNAVLSGFGRTGTTNNGDSQANVGNVRRAGLNRFDATRNETTISPENEFGILWGDVDGGAVGNDRICTQFGGPNSDYFAAFPQYLDQLCNTGVTDPFMEVGIGRGDSGGAAFVNGQIVGVASFGEAVINIPCIIAGVFQCVGAINTGFGYASLLEQGNRAWVESFIVTVPEPSSIALVGVGVLVLGAAARRRLREQGR